jgi:hypothetical protein
VNGNDEDARTAPTPEDPGRLQGDEPTPGNHSATDGNNNSDKTSAAQRKHRRQWLRAPDSAKLATIIVTAVIGAFVAFVFGIVNNLSTDMIKGADDCYETLTQFDENVSSDFFQLNHDFHLPVADPPTNEQWQRWRELARKYNTEIDQIYLKIESKCPVTGPSKYLNKNDVGAFNKNYEELSEMCFEALQCSDERADTVQRNSVHSAEKLIRQVGEVSQWGLLRRGWYAVSNLW